MAYLATVVVYYLPMQLKSWVSLAIVLFYGLNATIEVLHCILLLTPVTPMSVSLALSTNTREVHGFFVHFITEQSVLIAIGCLIIVFSLSAWCFFSKLIIKVRCWMSVIFLALLLASAALLIDKMTLLWVSNSEQMIMWDKTTPEKETLTRYTRILYSPPFPKWLYLLKSLAIANQEIDTWLKEQEKFYNVAATTTADSTLNIVVIIGESYIKSHSQLYGYYLNNTPNLAKEQAAGNLVVYNDMITTANFTKVALCNMFSLNVIGASDWFDQPYFPMVFKKAGWSVDFFTNQYIPGSVDESSRLYYSDFYLKNVYSHHNSSIEDYDMPFIEKALSESDLTERAPHIAFYHIFGQHYPQYLRYPLEQQYMVFSKDDVHADKPWMTEAMCTVVAQYANATYYNDLVVKKVIDAYRNRNAVIVYFSDHGEEMYDISPFANRNKQMPEDKEWLHRQYDVPFMIWMSDTYQRLNLNDAALIRDAANRPGNQGDLGQILLHLGRVSTPFYNAAADIISPDYAPSKERKTAMGYNYD